MTASERILAKALVSSSDKIDSAKWASIQAGLRDRAFFSAKVEEIRVLHAMREGAAKVAKGELSASEFRQSVRDALSATGYKIPKGREGSLVDVSSRKRLDLILETDVRQARGYVQHLEATSKGALLAEPCYELVRLYERKNPRDWRRIWIEKGGVLYSGRMIALKTDPIWTKISRFGNPFPPFDFGSGMGLDGVDRREALALGVITPEDKPQKPPKVHMNDSLQADIEGVRNDSPEAERLKQYFGDQIDIANGKVRWQEHILHDVMAGKVKKVKLGKATNDALLKIEDSLGADVAEKFKGKGLGLSHQFYVEHGAKHLNPAESFDHLAKDEFDLIPSVWRKPDRVSRSRTDPDRIEMWLDTLDGGSIMMVVDADTGIKSIQKRRPPREWATSALKGALDKLEPGGGDE